MYKLITIFSIIALVACGSSSDSKKEEKKQPDKIVKALHDPIYKAKALEETLKKGAKKVNEKLEDESLN